MEKLKGALIGYWAVAHNAHTPALRSRNDIDIRAVADADPERLRLAEAAFPEARPYPSLEALLETESHLDFLDLATPPWLHGRQVLMALERSLHVLCEKPLTLDTVEYRRIVETAQRRDRAVFTVNNWAYAPIWAKAADLSAASALGEVHHCELHAVRTRPSVAAGHKDWRTDANLAGGGILVDHGWHNLYLLKRMLFPQADAPEPVETAAFFHRPAPTMAETEATVFYRFPAATALLHLTWRGASRSNWAIFHGSQAALELHDDHLLLRPAAGNEQRFDFPEKLSTGSAHPEWFAALLPDFCAEVRDPGRRGRNLAESGFVLDLIRQAYDGGRKPRTIQRRSRATEIVHP